MKLLKEKILHIADFKWHLPFVFAVCFNLLNYTLILLVEDDVWLSSSQIDSWSFIVDYINVFILIILVLLIIYHLIKRRWFRAFITTIYSVSHSGISYFILISFIILVWQKGCSEVVDPCKCKNAKEDTYLMHNCKNHMDSLSKDLKNKWLEDQKDCDNTDENNNIHNSSVIPNDEVLSQNKVIEETNTSITNEVSLITWPCD